MIFNGESPFKGDNDFFTIEKVKKCKYEYIRKDIPEDVIDLLNNILIYKPPPINRGNEKSKKRNSKSKCSICLFIYRILLSLFRGIESNGELSYPKIYILDLLSLSIESLLLLLFDICVFLELKILIKYYFLLKIYLIII